MLRLVLINIFFISIYAQEVVDQTIDTQVDANDESAVFQQKIDKLDEESKRIYFEYKDTLNEYSSLKRYDDQLSEIIDAQYEEIESINDQLDSLDTINVDILPLLSDMVETLKKFVGLDIPFLKDERNLRISDLEGLLTRADISTAEKFRKIFEAYQIESNFGRTIESYTGYLKIDGENRAVDFFRLGRLGLFYRTPDGDESGYWDVLNDDWNHRGSRLSDEIKSALDVANRKSPPNFITLPIKPVTKDE